MIPNRLKSAIFIIAGQLPAERDARMQPLPEKQDAENSELFCLSVGVSGFGIYRASPWHCGYENPALADLLSNKYDNYKN